MPKKALFRVFGAEEAPIHIEIPVVGVGSAENVQEEKSVENPVAVTR